MVRGEVNDLWIEDAHQHKIHDPFFIRVVTKVFVIASGKARSNSMVLVHHAGDAVEAEAIELEFLHPVAEVAQQEPEDFVIPVVEEPAVPEVVASFASLMEVEVVSPVKFVQTIKNVLAGVRVDDIKENCDTQAVGSVNQLFQVFWRTVAGARRKEACYLISEG